MGRCFVSCESYPHERERALVKGSSYAKWLHRIVQLPGVDSALAAFSVADLAVVRTRIVIPALSLARLRGAHRRRLVAATLRGGVVGATMGRAPLGGADANFASAARAAGQRECDRTRDPEDQSSTIHRCALLEKGLDGRRGMARPLSDGARGAYHTLPPRDGIRDSARRQMVSGSTSSGTKSLRRRADGGPRGEEAATQINPALASPPGGSARIYPALASPPGGSARIYPALASPPGGSARINPALASPPGGSARIYPALASPPGGSARINPALASPPGGSARIYPALASPPGGSARIYPALASPPGGS